MPHDLNNSLRLIRYRRYKNMFDRLFEWVHGLPDQHLAEKICVRRADTPRNLRVGFKVWTWSGGNQFVYSTRLAEVKRHIQEVFGIVSPATGVPEKALRNSGLIWNTDGKSVARIKKIVRKIVRNERESRKNPAIMIQQNET